LRLGTLPPPPPTVQSVDYYAESYTEQGAEDSQQNSQHPPKNSQHLEIENTPVDFLKPDSETVSEIVNTSDAQGGGVCVPCASSNNSEEEISLKVGDTVCIKKTGEVGTVMKCQEIDKSYKIKVAEVEEWFYFEELKLAM
jgi:hypothetical protein